MPAGLLEQHAAQRGLGGAKALRNAGQIPDRIDGNLHDSDGAALVHDAVVALQSAGCERGLNLSEVEPRPGHRNGGTNINARRNLGGKRLRSQVPPGIERDNGVGIGPLRKWSDVDCRMGVRQVRATVRIERAGRHGKRTIERIGAAMAADDVAVARA